MENTSDGSVPEVIAGGFVITEAEREKILRVSFHCFDPLRLKAFPSKEKKKAVVLGKIAGQFRQGKTYTEPEVNAVLKAVYPDFPTIRRYLIEYGYLGRTPNGGEYWKK